MLPNRTVTVRQGLRLELRGKERARAWGLFGGMRVGRRLRGQSKRDWLVCLSGREAGPVSE